LISAVDCCSGFRIVSFSCASVSFISIHSRSVVGYCSRSLCNSATDSLSAALSGTHYSTEAANMSRRDSPETCTYLQCRFSSTSF
jgi:hypothetical protein